jgi:hypothetical protein
MLTYNFFLLILLVFFSDCNVIKKLYSLITKFPRKKEKYVASKLDLLMKKIKLTNLHYSMIFMNYN